MFKKQKASFILFIFKTLKLNTIFTNKRRMKFEANIEQIRDKYRRESNCPKNPG